MRPLIDRVFAAVFAVRRSTASAVAVGVIVLALVASSWADRFGGPDPDESTVALAAPTIAPLPEEVAVATPAPDRSIPIRQAAVTRTTPTPAPTPTPAAASVPANELGRIPIYMYHAFVYDEANADEWTITFDQFREQLEWLHANDFVAVGVNSILDRNFDVPAGKKPVVLTFDDANTTQFSLIEGPDGGYQPHPDTAVGVMESFRQQYPGFIQSAFFAVLPYNCFTDPDDPSTCEERLQWLAEHEYEIGNHTLWHQNLAEADDILIKEQILEPITWIGERVPEPWDLSDVLVLPFGMYPAEEYQKKWLFEGFWHHGEPFTPALVMEVTGGPARSPYHRDWATNLTRINTDPGTFWYYAERFDTGEDELFISDGDPTHVTVPDGWEDMLNSGMLDADGREVRTWATEPVPGS